LIIVSYGKIISSILKISSVRGRSKAFSTCTSHLIVVVLFYGTTGITYLQPKSNEHEWIGKLLSLFYFHSNLESYYIHSEEQGYHSGIEKITKLLIWIKGLKS
jgi:hypothetical protein